MDYGKREWYSAAMVTAVIPVRGGSRRLKDKNIQPFGDSNLLVHKIRQLKQVPAIDSIVVSSDSEVMLDMATHEGVVAHKRAPEFCDEQSKTFGEVVRHICEQVEGDTIVWALCTLPFIVPKHYQDMVDIHESRLGEHDSVLAAEHFKKYLFNAQGPVNFKLGTEAVASQNLPELFCVYGASVAPRNKMIEWHHHIGQHPYLYPIPKISGIDIDDELDMKVARAWYPDAERYL